MRTPIFTAALILSSAALAPAAGIVGSSANVNVRGAQTALSREWSRTVRRSRRFKRQCGVSPGALPGPGPDQTGTLPPAPLSLNSYYFSLDPVGTGAGSTTNGTLTFSPNERIIAVYGLNGTINDNFYPIFQSSGTTYPTGNRGLEDAGELPQASSLDTNVLNLNDLTANGGTGGGNIDQFRVVTANLDQTEKVANYNFDGSSADSMATATSWVSSMLKAALVCLRLLAPSAVGREIRHRVSRSNSEILITPRWQTRLLMTPTTLSWSHQMPEPNSPSRICLSICSNPAMPARRSRLPCFPAWMDSR